MSDVVFEDMDSNGMFAHLMDDSAEKMKWNRSQAIRLLEMATELDERAEKLRHLAAVLILEAQEFAHETAELLTMEFPMGDDESESEDSDDTGDEPDE